MAYRATNSPVARRCGGLRVGMGWRTAGVRGDGEVQGAGRWKFGRATINGDNGLSCCGCGFRDHDHKNYGQPAKVDLSKEPGRVSGRAWPGWLALGIGFVWLVAEWNAPPTVAPVPSRNWGEQSLVELGIVLAVMGGVMLWRWAGK